MTPAPLSAPLSAPLGDAFNAPVAARLSADFEVHRLRREVDIGCADDEHGVRQPVLISLRATLQARHLFAGEVYQPPYDYVAMVQAVDAAIASRPRFILQETLFVAIAARVLADPLIESLTLTLAKTARYEGCEGIGVQARVDRAQLAALAPHYPEDAALQALAAAAAPTIAPCAPT